jgi:hypothetical protein
MAHDVLLALHGKDVPVVQAFADGMRSDGETVAKKNAQYAATRTADGAGALILYFLLLLIVL